MHSLWAGTHTHTHNAATHITLRFPRQTQCARAVFLSMLKKRVRARQACRHASTPMSDCLVSAHPDDDAFDFRIGTPRRAPIGARRDSSARLYTHKPRSLTHYSARSRWAPRSPCTSESTVCLENTTTTARFFSAARDSPPS